MAVTEKLAHKQHEMDHADRVLTEVRQEREYQFTKWGGAKVDDRENDVRDFVLYIARFTTNWFSGGFHSDWGKNAGILREFRKSMVKVAALAVAAVQWADRRLQEHHDDEAAEAIASKKNEDVPL